MLVVAAQFFYRTRFLTSTTNETATAETKRQRLSTENMVQTKDHNKHKHKKEEIKEIGIGNFFKEIGVKITEK